MDHIVLSHFTKEPFDFNPNTYYMQHDSPSKGYKPHGLWLSDESEKSVISWKEWCTQEHFYLEQLKTETLFEVDLSRVLWIQTMEQLLYFDHRYKLRDPTFFVDWEKVADEYAGILITPYRYEARLKLSWYYTWDCASGCFWDLSVLKHITERRLVYDQQSAST